MAWDNQTAKGFDKYQVDLCTFNGRDPGQDCLEELVDAVQYLTQLRMENQWLQTRVEHLESVLKDAAMNAIALQ